MIRTPSIVLAFSLLAAGCADISPTMRPDYTIRVTPTETGSVVTLPPCPSWNDETANPFDAQPLPQFGCSTARNLASMAENPNDLVEGRPLDNARGVKAVGTVRRYDNDQPRGLVLPASETSQIATTTAPTGASSMSGDVTAGGAPSSGPPAAP